MAVIESFERQGGELDISVVEFRGKQRLDIRLMIWNDEKGEKMPTKKGVQISEEEMPRFLEAIDRANAVMSGAQEEEDAGGEES